MARKPSLFVRSLSMDEGRKLARITRSAKDPVRFRRAIVVMMSDQGQVSERYVWDVIHAFNERGSTRWTPVRAAVHPRRVRALARRCQGGE